MIMHFHNDPKNKCSHTAAKERADFKETNPPKTQVIHALCIANGVQRQRSILETMILCKRKEIDLEEKKNEKKI